MFKSLKVLVVDTTHGGAVIASEFLKFQGSEVFAWDIYSTMDGHTREKLQDKGIKFIGSLEDLENLDDILIIAPIHSKIEPLNMTHHDSIKYLLKDRINVPIIEVTGVKGKTSVVWILKEIFKDIKPLVLSSLGIEIIENGKWKTLKNDISITPASIIQAWNLAEGKEVGICIFETSLGGTGLADVGVLTNIAEDYPIAGGIKKASDAKMQIFKSKSVICNSNSFKSKYLKFDYFTNTFEDSEKKKSDLRSNLKASNINFEMDKTNFKVEIKNFKTVQNNIINETMEFSTFAPAPFHLNNVLAAVGASLMLEYPIERIKKGLINFRGVNGRTSIIQNKGIRVIEEVNPGLNVVAVKKVLDMVEDMDDVAVVFGGEYGVTCEEIDEKSVSHVLNELKDNIPLILADELGFNVKKFLKRDFMYYQNLNDAMDFTVENNPSNILLIYRSNFSDVKKR